MRVGSDQEKVLKYLYDRIQGGETRYCTIPTIKKNSGVIGSNQYILSLTDDLETSGYIITRQAYQMSGGRLFQITAAGIDLIENGNAKISVQSSAWTGRIDLTEGRKAEIREKLAEIRKVVESANLTNSQRCNALAIIEATEILVETPDPLWPEIMRLLRSPVLSNLQATAGLILGIISLILSAANS